MWPGTKVGQEKWRSRNYKLWHSVNSLFLTSFSYLSVQNSETKGCRNGDHDKSVYTSYKLKIKLGAGLKEGRRFRVYSKLR